MTASTMRIGEYEATVKYDPDIEMFRGEFLGLNGGADFYAADVAGLKREAEISLEVFLEACQEKGIDPVKKYSGKFNVRLNPELHQLLAVRADAEHMSLNALVAETLNSAVTVVKETEASMEDFRQLMAYVSRDGMERYLSSEATRTAPVKRKAASRRKATAKKKTLKAKRAAPKIPSPG